MSKVTHTNPLKPGDTIVFNGDDDEYGITDGMTAVVVHIDSDDDAYVRGTDSDGDECTWYIQPDGSLLDSDHVKARRVTPTHCYPIDTPIHITWEKEYAAKGWATEGKIERHLATPGTYKVKMATGNYNWTVMENGVIPGLEPSRVEFGENTNETETTQSSTSLVWDDEIGDWV